MKSPTECALEDCGCRVEPAFRYCSAGCEAAAARASTSCSCGHMACHSKDQAADRSIDGVQGEGNREADRRYREGATKFANSGRTEEAARDAAVDLDELEREGRKQRENP